MRYLTKKEIEYINSRYNPLIKKYGYDPRSLGWVSKQDLRFDIILSMMKNTELKDSVLDVGCGFGDFYKKCNSFIYNGIDINKNFIDIGNSKFPMRDIKLGTINDKCYENKKFDWVVSSGIFCHKLEGWTHTMVYIRKMLRRMFKICRKGVITNFLTLDLSKLPHQNNVVFYVAPSTMVSISDEISRYVSLRHDYIEKEFTLAIYKKRYESL